MKPGVVCTAFLVVAGAAGGVAVTLKDQSKLEAAKKACDDALALLEKGEEAKAREEFGAALKSAEAVSPFTGLRGDALHTAARCRVGLRTLEALDRAEEDPLATLRALEGREKLPPRAAEVVARLRARLQLESAQALELRDATREAAKAYELAVKAAQDSGSPLLADAQRGQRRNSLLVNLRAAETALRLRNEDQAETLARAASKTIAEPESPFDDPTRVAGIKRRVDSILAEVKSGKLLARYERELDLLYEAVDSPKLGTLLPTAQRLQVPKLGGGHPNAGAHTKRLAGLERRHKAVLRVAKEFQNMVFATRTDEGTVFVDRTEVTGADFARFIADGGYKNRDLWTTEGWRRVTRFTDRDNKKQGPKTFRNGRPPKGWGRHPVTGITYHEAEAFANWRGKRLPTVEEWQAAASKGTAYPWGNEFSKGRSNIKSGAKPRLQAVGSFPAGAGPTGALDMIGNAREIVKVSLKSKKYRELGGSYRSLPEQATIRSGGSVSAFERTTDLGFRCAKVLKKWDD